jgi:hypothetical protein
MLLTAAILFFSAKSSIAGETKGTITHSKGTVTVKFSYLIKGPDAFDAKKIIKRVILSAKDIAAPIQACTTMSCVDSTVTEGMTVDFVGGPRLNYWMAVSNGLIQYSGTLEPVVLKISSDQPKEMAGKLNFDDASAGGPKVNVDFDAVLLKEFTQAR